MTYHIENLIKITGKHTGKPRDIKTWMNQYTLVTIPTMYYLYPKKIRCINSDRVGFLAGDIHHVFKQGERSLVIMPGRKEYGYRAIDYYDDLAYQCRNSDYTVVDESSFLHLL